jgi:imidazolonepropionase
MPAGSPTPVDLVITGASAVATCAPSGSDLRRPARGAELADAALVEGGSIAIDGGRILEVGPSAIATRYAPRQTLDARGGLVIPGLVDAHTHPVFVRGREDEFERRLRGESYSQIAAAGGGILASVRGVREASDEELASLVRRRLDRFLALGTTAVEAKSGYGLSARDELRSLRAIARAAAGHAVRVVPTLLAAHALPAEWTHDRRGYLRAVQDELVPAVVSERLALFHDVFVDPGFFTIQEARELLGSPSGLRPKLHADELAATGAAELAVELGAASADHLDHVSRRGIERLAASSTVAVLLPGVSHFLRAERDAPARDLVSAGAAVALATDFNPGTCPTQSLFEVMHLAAVRMRLSAQEALVASTRNAAFAIGLGGEAGVLAPGVRADLVVCDVPDVRDLAYAFGRPPVAFVVAAGRIETPAAAAPASI